MAAQKRKWAVVHLIHVNTPHRHIVKLVIEDVPADFNKRDVEAWLDEVGYSFSEFGQEWANHYLSPLSECEPEVRGAYRSRSVEIVQYEEPEPIE